MSPAWLRLFEHVDRRLLSSPSHLDRFLQIVEEGHQSTDLPVHPAMPETAYLKACFARVLPS
jgi:23S rRNA (cytosine1962-C5)-methyltransferase